LRPGAEEIGHDDEHVCRGDDFRGFNGHFTCSRGTVASPNLVSSLFVVELIFRQPVGVDDFPIAGLIEFECE
jgi:hypothetical protein